MITTRTSLTISACAALLVLGCRENRTGLKEHGMENCPSMVTGARTDVTEIENGVELRMTSDNPTSVEQIRRLARGQASVSPDPDKKITHTGEGTGGGRVGFCPIVHVGTQVEVEDIDQGVRISVRAKDPASTSKLRAMTRERVAALSQPNPELSVRAKDLPNP